LLDRTGEGARPHMVGADPEVLHKKQSRQLFADG